MLMAFCTVICRLACQKNSEQEKNLFLPLDQMIKRHHCFCAQFWPIKSDTQQLQILYFVCLHLLASTLMGHEDNLWPWPLPSEVMWHIWMAWCFNKHLVLIFTRKLYVLSVSSQALQVLKNEAWNLNCMFLITKKAVLLRFSIPPVFGQLYDIALGRATFTKISNDTVFSLDP